MKTIRSEKTGKATARVQQLSDTRWILDLSHMPETDGILSISIECGGRHCGAFHLSRREGGVFLSLSGRKGGSKGFASAIFKAIDREDRVAREKRAESKRLLAEVAAEGGGTGTGPR